MARTHRIYVPGARDQYRVRGKHAIDPFACANGRAGFSARQQRVLDLLCRRYPHARYVALANSIGVWRSRT